MRVAVVSQLNSPGGGSRFLRCLCRGLAHQPEIEHLALCVDAEALTRDALLEFLPEGPSFTVLPIDREGRFANGGRPSVREAIDLLRVWALRQPRLVHAYRTVRRLDGPNVEPPPTPRMHLAEDVLDYLSAFDVVYFAWPRHVAPPDVNGALVATFHDFNHRHLFGNYRQQDVQLLEAESEEWLRGCVQPIVSTRFIAQELDEYYPSRRHAPAVVYLSSFALSDPSPVDEESARERYGLPESFVICPTNIAPHKNVDLLLRAVGALKRAGRPVNLVLTGAGTQCLGRDPGSDPLYADLSGSAIDELNGTILEEGLELGRDLWTLGYVSDLDVDALVGAANLVVAPSLYEAGSGPALDAWKLGTPVASSALPSVVEQMGFLGTEAALFDPTDLEAIQDALVSSLDDPRAARDVARRSQVAMTRYTWDEVAAGYLNVFGRALEQRGDLRRQARRNATPDSSG